MRMWTKRIWTFVILLLLFTYTFSVHAVQTDEAAEAEAQRITQQVKTIYSQARRRNGGSMAGYCGRATDYQLYLLGINSTLEFRDGKDQFDRYKDAEMTSGGYHIRAYPATNYTLEEALNEISFNGSKDVYNILLGFQWTNTEAGNIYGHTMFIHAILDGQVYFTESYTMYIDGKYRAEGEAIVCSIETFCNYYNRWTRLDGVVHFVEESYVDYCVSYPAHMYVQVTQATPIYTEPRSTDSETVRMAYSGDRIYVTGLYQNTEGEYYYALRENHTEGYIRADSTKVLTFCTHDVMASNVKAPTRLWRGNSYNLSGTISAAKSYLSSVTVQIYSRTDGTILLEHTAETGGNSYSLNNTAMNKAIKFSSLEDGDYIYKILAVTENYYIRNGQLALRENSVTLWTSNILINRSSSTYRTITFDACGGESTLDQMPVVNKGSLSLMPTATRAGYRFDGWYLEDGTRVTLETTFKKNTTLYAHWTAEAPEVDGWHFIDGVWRYCLDGQLVTGWVTEGNTSYYFSEYGMYCGGWAQLDEVEHYFCASGAAIQGEVALDSQSYYFKADGSIDTDWVSGSVGVVPASLVEEDAAPAAAEPVLQAPAKSQICDPEVTKKSADLCLIRVLLK